MPKRPLESGEVAGAASHRPGPRGYRNNARTAEVDWLACASAAMPL
jgi:hypothetical protein